MIKCSIKSCLEPAFKDGFCEAHYEHEQRILAAQNRIAAGLSVHGVGGGVVNKVAGLQSDRKPSTPRARRTPRPADQTASAPQVKAINNPCRVPGCPEQATDLVLCKGCLSAFAVWRKYRQQNKASPMTPTPQQQTVFDQLFALALQPPRHS